MNFTSFLLPVLFLSSACSLVQQDLPNETPVLQASRVDTLQVKRGGRITLSVQAADEDDDPLFYFWNSFGVGTFTDSTNNATDWIAPLKIEGNSEKFVLTVHIRDRDCLAVPDPENRRLCEEQARQTIETFLIEVIQTPPFLTVATIDTTLSFRQPIVELSAIATDAEDDPLEFKWTQTAGELRLDIQSDPVEEGLHRIRFVPLKPDDYRIVAQVSDGSDTVSTEIAVRVFADPEPPEGRGNMASLSITRTDSSIHQYEIDVYEYPNEKGVTPELVDNWFQAAALCEAEGKRLCRRTEWLNACQGGAEPRAFSSNDDPNGNLLPRSFGFRYCNVQGSAIATDAPNNIQDFLAPSGAFPNCSTIGIYDLSGNAAEWVENTNAFLERLGSVQLGSVLGQSDCGTFDNDFTPLPDGFDISSQEAIDALDVIDYSGYLGVEGAGRGFRCCR